MANITENPDYQLLMKYLKSITPNDMDQESSEQLMMIGERMKAGGSLSDREREMFEAVVGAMPQMPETEMSYEVDGSTERMSPEMMDSLIRSGQVTPDEMSSYQVDGQTERLAPSQMGGITSRPMPQAPSGAPTVPMPSQDGKTYSQSSGVTPANNVMTLEEAVAAGIVAPTARPQARPAPMRPQARPTR